MISFFMFRAYSLIHVLSIRYYEVLSSVLRDYIVFILIDLYRINEKAAIKPLIVVYKPQIMRRLVNLAPSKKIKWISKMHF